MRTRTASHLVLATLGMLWLAAVAHSVRYRDMVWLQVLFVDITWLQVLLLIVGAYGAFLVLAGALARSRRPAQPQHRPFVSLVVPAKNEETVIEASVRGLCAQDYAEDGHRRFEVLVVDDRSTDRTPEILSTLAKELPLTVLQTRVGSVGKAAALNFGIARAGGDVLAVFDADARVDPGFLTKMAAHLDGEGVGGVQSQRRLYNAGQNWWTRLQVDEHCLFQHLLQKARQALGGMVSFAGNGLLVKRAALDDVGGWNEDALTEDIDLSVRLTLAGWEIRYCPEAIVWEEAVPGLRGLLRQRVRWFDGAMRCLGESLPGILFGRGPLFRRIDVLLFLGGALVVTLGLLTTYLYGLIDFLGGVVFYLQLPRWMAMWASAVLTATFLAGLLVYARGRIWEVALILIRSAVFSLHRLLVVPLAITRYARGAITGEVAWEKTAHGSSDWTVRTRSEDEL